MKKYFALLRANDLDAYQIVLKIVLILTVFVSLTSFLFFYFHGLTLAYGDAKAHLNIARRVLFSLTPGLTQLGGIWLPLPHLMDMLTVWNDQFYYSGISGSIISMISYVMAVIIIFKAVYFYTKRLWSATLGALIMMLCPAFLYLQSTPMTELLSIATSLIPIYLLIKWSRSGNLATLIVAAFFVMISTLSRYDNLFLIATSLLVITSVMYVRKQSRHLMESRLILFFTLASIGFLIWLLYNQVIFGSAFYFAFGVGSASWFASAQNAFTKFNLPLSIEAYFWLMVDNIGIITLILTFLGVVVFSINNKFRAESIPAYLFITPIIFNILSLFLGQSIVHTQHLPPYNFYNTRYGINALPAAAFFIALLADSIKKYSILLVLILILQYYVLFSTPLPLIKDIQTQNPLEVPSALWVRDHPASGLTLMSTGTFDSLVFDARIPEETIVYEGSGQLWRESLNNPYPKISRIIIGDITVTSDNADRDEVGKFLSDSIILKNEYHLVFSNNYIDVYDRN